MSTAPTDLHLKYGFSFETLYTRGGLAKLDAVFLDCLQSSDTKLYDELLAARLDPASIARKKASDLVIALAPHFEDFIGSLFGIEKQLATLRSHHDELAPLYTVKRKFVQRKAVTSISKDAAMELDGDSLAADMATLLDGKLTELNFASAVDCWLGDEKAYESQLKIAAEYAAWATLTPAGRKRHGHGVLFQVAHKLDMEHLVPVEQLFHPTPKFQLPESHWRHREGFKLTDAGMDLTGALDEANYCIKCHNQAKDSCSTGLKEKTGEFKHSIFGVTLAGCPLDQKISEMNVVKQNANPIGALAIVVIDNPMCAATGHRICNDCMKSCIFQKQEPVDIPQIETRGLKDVLELPWGFEIYSLLTRWNPLNFSRPLPKPATGYKVLVVGLGPAGFTLSHHLMNDGHTVVAIDGLKLEPLPAELSGIDAYGNRKAFKAIRDIHQLYESLDDRVMAGFGGVAEYGITVRWNKNFLKLIRLLLERRNEFVMFGGIRFGGTITVEQAFEMGFDHIALCAGAGRPTVIPMKNGLARGVRQASDFLMSLQLTGAAKKDSITNLQVRMPVVVIGGGLTAVDTATESMAYYIVQIEKFLTRYETLVKERSEQEVRANWSPEEREIGVEFLAHARQVRAERFKAAAAGREPNLIRLIHGWGGVTIAYRRRLIDAPSYTLNHEEVDLAMQEGIWFAECLTPQAVEVDEYGYAKELRVTKHPYDPETKKFSREGTRVVLPARTILVAAGTQPNTVLAREDSVNIHVDGKYFQAVDETGAPVKPEKLSKPAETYVLSSVREDGRGISYFGDLHPSFAGNVVKAMGSAKRGYPVVSSLLAKRAPAGPTSAELLATLNEDFRAVVSQVVRLTPNIVEVIVKAPAAARAFEPGQFYRLQNFETLATRTGGTTLAMEGLALTGASVDKEKGLLSTIVLEMGGSSDLCALLKPGEPVILMGPTGTATHTPGEEVAMLVGGGLGNAVLFSIGQRLRENGSKVVYFAGYKKVIDRYKIDEIERAADVVIWCCDEAPGFPPTRPQDATFTGNIVAAMVAYATGQLGIPAIPLNTVDRVIAIGSDGMMRAVAQARHGVLEPFLRKGHEAIGSINSPMQCMMKEICAQCLQQHIDPVTGEETVVFSCFNQDQSLDRVDFNNLRARLSQNGVQEKLTKLWIDRCLVKIGHRAATEYARA